MGAAVISHGNFAPAFDSAKHNFNFIQRAVKPRPSGRGYKAHLSWNFAFSLATFAIQYTGVIWRLVRRHNFLQSNSETKGHFPKASS